MTLNQKEIACFALSVAADEMPPAWVQVFPFGRYFVLSVGDFWEFNAAIATALADRFKTEGVDVPIDREHSFMHVMRGELNPDQADAYGWIDRLEVRADGLFAHVKQWTDQARELITSRKVRYMSPTIIPGAPHRLTGARSPWLATLSLTNIPNLVDIEPLAASAGVGMNGNHKREGENMKEKLLKLLRATNVTVADDADDAALLSALETRLGQAAPQMPPEIATALGDPKITIAAAAVEIARLRNEEKAPVDATAIAADVRERMRREALLEKQVACGAIDPTMKDTFAGLLGSKDPAVAANAEKVVAAMKPRGPLAPGLNVSTDPPAVAASAEQALTEKYAKQLGADLKVLDQKNADAKGKE